MEVKEFLQAISYTSDNIKNILLKIDNKKANKITEIRLRANKPLSVVINGINYFVSNSGEVSFIPDDCLNISKHDIDIIFNKICQYSLHSYDNEIAQGFITVEGGHRVGLCGTAVIKNSKVSTIKNITGLNIRIAKQMYGCAEELYNLIFNTQIKSLLIIGNPLSGKTTILRDLCRLLGKRYKVSIIDERNEISAASNGIINNNIGEFSDVFNSFPKEDGIITAIRVMSPDIVVCDEIGGENDVKALGQAIKCGVKIIATAHAGSVQEILTKVNFSSLIDINAFDCIVCLGTKDKIGQIVEYKEMRIQYA